MKNSKELQTAYSNNVQNTFIEKQLWRTGYKEFLESRKERKEMFIIFSMAEENSGIAYIGLLQDIFIDEEKKLTKYSFIMLSKLKSPKPLSKLHLLKTGKSLSDDYIRPYAVVKLPKGIDKWQDEDRMKETLKTIKFGNEAFSLNKEKHNSSLLNFWQWSFSDLTNNTLRGTLAEYIVAMALGIDDRIQIDWKSYDLDYENLKIEVKSSAYIQSWAQKDYSKILFNVPTTKAFDATMGSYDENSKRQSDIYVFCVLSHKIQDTLDPLNLNQWQFYIAETKSLNYELGNNKTVSLAKLKKIKVLSCDYNSLKVKIDSIKNKYDL